VIDGDGVLIGKVALVTGGSRGLGREMVRAFAAQGADVVIASRKLEACEELAAEVRARHGHDALPIACNVSDWEQCDGLADQALAHYGRVDVLVNNAGLSPLYPSVEEVSEVLWDKVIGVNLKGPFRLTARIGTAMVQGGRGSIINISSVAAIRPDATVLPYAAAKAGLNALTEGFAVALAPAVRVNAIMAGMFRTDISKAWGDPAAVEEMARGSVPLQRVGEPGEVVGAALFLASDASSYATGSVLRLDGGVSI
jgi:NAD(P)-dependent dehydrogenase (short-subunit alcohol dehydrogenase family)